MSGHSKWANIKHRKGAQDAKRAKVFTRLIRELTIASRQGGGDAEANPRLRAAVQNARGSNMPNDTIEKAIKRGTGELEGVVIEEITYDLWHDYESEDTLRFYALRLHEAGMLENSPNALIADGTDWRFVNELKRELKG